MIKSEYVVLKTDVGKIEKNSVGIVLSESGKKAEVFFIGKAKKVNVNVSDIKEIDINKTGKSHKYKICNTCYILKREFVDFEVNQTDAHGNKTTRPSCRDCRKIIDGVALLPSERKKMEEIKPTKIFVCPICKKASIPFVTANLVIDHDHSTGKAREWICDSCNTGLGRFKDDIGIMKQAIKYLRKYDAK